MTKGTVEVTDSAKASMKERDGLVVSNRMQKTVVVAVTRKKRHPKYKKYVSTRKKYYAHDENNSCGIGDLVRIVETRPLSKLKRWKVSKILAKAGE